MLVLSLIFLLFGDTSQVLSIMNESIGGTIELCIALCAIYVLWMGILQIADDCGVSKLLADLLAPLIRFLFGNISPDASRFIAMNLSANILGLGNASTPAGLKAMKELDRGDIKPTQAMIMLFALNCCSLQLLPTTIISLRVQNGSVNSSDIIIPVIIVSIICFVLCATLVKVCFRSHKGRR